MQKSFVFLEKETKHDTKSVYVHLFNLNDNDPILYSCNYDVKVINCYYWEKKISCCFKKPTCRMKNWFMYFFHDFPAEWKMVCGQEVTRKWPPLQVCKMQKTRNQLDHWLMVECLGITKYQLHLNSVVIDFLLKT